MVYPNQYYPQNNYMPPYQNFQAQQRQEQLNQVFANSYNYNFTRDRAEAENWPIAPGNNLVFRDQNGGYFYVKSLGYGPNEKPIFTIYKREDYVEQPQQSEVIEQNPLKDDVDNLKKEISDLKEMITQLANRPTYNKFDKKGGNK